MASDGMRAPKTLYSACLSAYTSVRNNMTEDMTKKLPLNIHFDVYHKVCFFVKFGLILDVFLIGIFCGFQLFEDGEVCQLTALYSELPIMARLLRAKNRRLHLIKSFQVCLMNTFHFKV
jgi:hypothetical protein